MGCTGGGGVLLPSAQTQPGAPAGCHRWEVSQGQRGPTQGQPLAFPEPTVPSFSWASSQHVTTLWPLLRRAAAPGLLGEGRSCSRPGFLRRMGGGVRPSGCLRHSAQADLGEGAAGSLGEIPAFVSQVWDLGQVSQCPGTLVFLSLKWGQRFPY